MTNDLDEKLAQALRANDSDHIDPSTVSAAIARGKRTQRRARVTSVLASGGLVVAAAAGVSIAGHRLSGSDSSGSGPADQPPSSQTQSPLEWAQSLPEGTNPGVTFAAGRKLHRPNGVVELSGTEVTLIGQTVAGTAVLIENDQTESGGSFSSEYAIVAENGEVTSLPSARDWSVQNAAVSPDGTEIAYGSAVRDARTQSVVADIPPDTVSILSWTPVGLVIDSKDGTQSLWQPGSPPVSLSQNPGVYPAQTTAGFRNKRPCTDVVRLDAGGVVTRTSDGCLDQPLFSVSPDGDVALDVNLGVVDVASGETEEIPGNPIHAIDAYTSIAWVDDTDFVFPVTDPLNAPDDRSFVLVECSTSELACTRLSTVMTVPANTEVQVTK